MGDFYEHFLSLLASRFPGAEKNLGDFRRHLSPLLICPHVVELPRSLADQAREIVAAFFDLRSLPERAHELAAREPQVADPGHSSVLMSYDFHVDAAGNLRLIEINTNASMSLFADLLHEHHSLENIFAADRRSGGTFIQDIMACFKAEHARGCPGRDLHRVAIVDDHPFEQKLFIEFALYQELFLREGFECFIADSADLHFRNDRLERDDQSIDLVYNRDTDFYFTHERSVGLRAASRARAACVTPNAHEYRLLADKDRLLELSKPDAIANLPLSESARAAIAKTLIRMRGVHDFESPDALWAERRRWFFKPARSFGGKATYRGSSISRGTFAEMQAQRDYLAQEFVPAPQVKFPNGDEFKYDLRFYVYEDRVQLACARVYQGQMTNSQTPGGGLASDSLDLNHCGIMSR